MEFKKMTSITITGGSVEEIKQEIAKLAKTFGVDVSEAQMALPLASAMTPGSQSMPALAHTTPVSEEKTATEKKTRKSGKAEPEAHTASEASMPAKLEAPKTQAPKTVASAEAAEQLFRQVLSEKGVGVAKPLIESFGVPKFRDLPSEKYGELIAKCNEILVA